MSIRDASILAPVSGTITQATVREAGTVMAAGEVLMRIVEQDQAPIIEASIAVADIDEIAPDQAVRIDLSPLDPIAGQTINARITQISADRETDNQGTNRFTIRVEPEQEIALPTGAPVRVLIPTAEQTLIARLLSPLTRRIEDGLSAR